MTVGYFNHDHPITGILVSIGKQVLPKQPELQIKMFHQANQINVDQMKSCQIALCLPHTTYGSTLSCFCMSSNTFYQTLQTSASIPCHSAFTVVWLPTDPHVQLTMLCYTKVRDKVILMFENSWIKRTKRNLEYINTKDMGL